MLKSGQASAGILFYLPAGERVEGIGKMAPGPPTAQAAFALSPSQPPPPQRYFGAALALGGGPVPPPAPRAFPFPVPQLCLDSHLSLHPAGTRPPRRRSSPLGPRWWRQPQQPLQREGRTWVMDTWSCPIVPTPLRAVGESLRVELRVWGQGGAHGKL